MDGKCLLDDGYQTVSALKRCAAAESLPANVKDVLEQGLEVDFRCYGDSYERELHIAFQTLRHDEAQNRFRPSSVWQKVNVVHRFALKSPGKDLARVAQALLDVFGKSKKATIARWVRAYGNLHAPVLDFLKSAKSLPDSYVFDNPYLLGPGQQKLQPADAVISLELLRRVREDGRAMNPEAFKAQICSPMLVKATWCKTMKAQFGAAMLESPAS